MSLQKDVFLASEGDQWFLRNNKALVDKVDKISVLLERLAIQPRKVLEIGCANGWRLQKIHEVAKCECYGIDPSSKAIDDGTQKFPAISLATGTADDLPFPDNSFDVIIFGFCLYAVDRNDLFKVAAEADRCLANGGKIIVYDFCPPFPYKNTYAHLDSMFTYKMNYAAMFLWNPAYFEIYSEMTSHAGHRDRSLPDERLTVTILEKRTDDAYVANPFKH